jgi:hypothetical protein
VKAPRTCPNISLSKSDAGTPPRFTLTNGRDARGLLRCSASATSSFPVPLSPVISTDASVGATWRAVHNTYLEYAVDLGMPGLVLFVLLLRSCWRSVSAARRTASPETAQLAEGIEISLLAFSVAAFFHPAAYEFYFYFVAGLAVAAKVVSDREGPVAA